MISERFLTLGDVDVMLTSVSVPEPLRRDHGNGDSLPLAIRGNDATDIRGPRHGRYKSLPLRPLRSASLACAKALGCALCLYSLIFNNDLEADLRSLEAYQTVEKLGSARQPEAGPQLDRRRVTQELENRGGLLSETPFRLSMTVFQQPGKGDTGPNPAPESAREADRRSTPPQFSCREGVAVGNRGERLHVGRCIGSRRR